MASEGYAVRLRARDRLAWLAVQGVIAAAAFAVVGAGFFAGAPGRGPVAAIYAGVAIVSTGAILALLLALPLMPLVALARSDVVTFGVVPAVLTVLTAFAEADLVIFRIYRIHVNGMILNLLTTRGGEDSFTLGHGTWVSASILFSITLAAQVGVSWLLLRRLSRRQGAAPARAVLRVALPFLLACVLVDKGTFVWGSFNGRPWVTRVERRIPLYRGVSAQTFLRERLGLKSQEVPSSPGFGGALDYPKAPIVFDPGAKRWNVLLVAVEGMRWDMVTPEVMPFLSRWSTGQIVCERNVSGGNASRYGIFSLLYGVDATLWRPFRDERVAPALLEALRREGYAFRILSGTDLHYPEFRQTAFRELTSAITDSWPGARVDRDRLQTDALVAFADADRRPFFAFTFYDASHQPYLFPPQDAIFRPVLAPRDLDYVRLAAGHRDQVPLLFNRYRNSLHYVDRELERLIGALDARGLLADTLVFICGDHGEEFGEGGLVGHNSAFDAWQIRTPMIVHVPGAAPRRIARLTSHEDVVPTIGALLGVRNPASDYSQGVSLLDDGGPSRRVVASWDSAAVVGDADTVVFGTEATALDVRVIDPSGRPVQARPAAYRGDLLLALERMTQFRR